MGVYSNYETTLHFIVNSVSVYSKLNDFFEIGKDNGCFCNFPLQQRSVLSLEIYSCVNILIYFEVKTFKIIRV